MEPLRALLVQCLLAVAAALIAKRAKTLAVLFGVAAFSVPPWFAGRVPLLRGLCALVGFIGCFRIIDVVRVGASWSASRRIAHVMSFVDTRTLRRELPHLDWRALGRALAWAAPSALGIHLTGSSTTLVRWTAALVAIYAGLEAGYALVGVLYRALGFVTPPLHVLPLASTSVGELWGDRWARPVSAWLRETCFRPLVRRRRPMLGLLLGFVVSAIGHAYPVLVATDASMAALMFAFFVAQAGVVLLEARLGTNHWWRPAGRLWTIAIMLATSPLFLVPALRVLD